jgi:hypothetical protein
MDGADLGKALGAGVAVGILTLLSITVVVLPASWVMNRFVYHNTLMRILLGVATASMSVVSFVIVLGGCLLGFLNKPYYFGLLPTFMATGDTAPTGWMAPFIRVWNAFSHPLQLTIKGEQDHTALVESMKVFLVKEEDSDKMDVDQQGLAEGTLKRYSGMGPNLPIVQGAVCEPFFEAARRAGAAPEGKWRRAMEDLSKSGVGQFLFSGSIIQTEPEVSIVTPSAATPERVISPEEASMRYH